MYFSKQGANKGQCPPPLVIVFGIFMSSCKSILLERLYKIDLCSLQVIKKTLISHLLIQGTDVNPAQGQDLIH